MQATALTATEIKRRTVKYCNDNVYVLWVLPYERFRFIELQTTYEPDDEDDDNDGYRAPSYILRDRVRLREYEIFLFLAYYRKLIFASSRVHILNLSKQIIAQWVNGK